jgi:glycosidase
MKDLPDTDWIGFNGKYVPTDHFRTAIGDPYSSAVDRLNYTSGWFAPTMPDVNQANPLVATYQIQNAIWWVEEAGLSGLRIDTYGYSDTQFLSAWSRRLMEEYPAFNMVGEEWSSNPVVLAYWMRGNTGPRGTRPSLPSLMDFPLNEALRKALATPEGFHTGLADLYSALVNDRLYSQPMNMVLFEGNHDMPRLYSVLGNDVGLTQMALTYVLTMRGIPQFYYGTEVLMPSPVGRDDGETRRDFPGGWSGDAVNAFTGQGLTPEQTQTQAFLRKLMNWRKGQVALHRGALTHYTPQAGAYTYFRYAGRDQVMVVLNKNTEDVQLETARFSERLAAYRRAKNVLTGEDVALGATLRVPARSVLILEMH